MSTTEKTFTPVSPQEALRILADAGKPVDGLAFRDDEVLPWTECWLNGADVNPEAGLGFFTSSGWYRQCARVTVAPKIASGHNPERLTEEDVGVSDGWRLLTKDELWQRDHMHDDGIEFSARNGCIWDGQFVEVSTRYGKWAFRTKHPAGHYLPKPQRLVPWTLETCPKSHMLLRDERETCRFHVPSFFDANGITAGFHREWSVLLASFLYSVDGARTWAKCGTLEGEK